LYLTALTTRTSVCRNYLTGNIFNWSFKNLDERFDGNAETKRKVWQVY